MFQKCLSTLVVLFFVISALSNPAQAQQPSTLPPNPARQPLPQEWYLEVPLPAAPSELPAQDLQDWYEQQVQNGLEMLLPVLETYRKQNLLQDFSPFERGVRLTAPQPLVLQELQERGLAAALQPLDGMEPAAAASQTPAAQRIQQEMQQAGTAEQSMLPPDQQPKNSAKQPEESSAATTMAAVAPGHFAAQLFTRSIGGITTTQYASVNVTITRLGVVVASQSTMSDSTGWWELYISISNFKLIPGDLVLVQASGQPDTSLVLPNATGAIHLANDLVTGDAPAEAPVLVSVSGINFPTTASTDGSYSVDTSATFDLTTQTNGYVTITDPASGNQVVFNIYAPYYALTMYKSICGYSGESAFNQQLLLTIRNSGGDFKIAYAVTPEPTGYFCYNYSSVYWIPSDIIEFTAASGELIQVVIPPVSTSFSIQTDTISGMVSTGGSSYQITVRDFETATSYYDFPLVPGVDGTFSIITTASMDLTPRDSGYIFYYTAVGHQIYYDFTVPYLVVDKFDRRVYGYSLPSTAIQVALYTGSGSLQYMDITTTDSVGYFSFYQQAIPIAFGDRVVVTPSGASQITVWVTPITIVPDISADTVSGVALPNSLVEVKILKTMLNTYYSGTLYTFSAQADSTGAYSATITNDLIPGDRVEALNTNPEGNVVRECIGYLPSKVFVDAWANTVTVYTSPETSATLQVKDSGGTIKASVGGTSNFTGTISFGAVGDIAAGDRIEVSSASTLTSFTVIPLDITELDRDLNRFSGHSLPSTTIGFNIRGNNYFSTTTNSSGDASWLIDPAVNMKGGDRVSLSYKVGNNRQANFSYVPSMAVYQLSNYVTGYAAPSSGVVIYRKDSMSNILETVQTPASPSNGRYYAYFATLFETGDIFELHNAGQVYLFTLPTLTISMDTAADLVTGTGPGDAIVQLYISKNIFSSYNSSVQFNESGLLSVDLSVSYDILNLSTGRLTYPNLEGDSAVAYHYAEGISLNRETDTAYGYAVPDSTVNLTLKHDTVLKAAQTLTTSTNGYYATGRICSGSTPVDVISGDTLFASPPALDVTVPAVTATFNFDTDVLTVTGPANTELFLEYMHWVGSGFSWRPEYLNTGTSGVVVWNVLDYYLEGITVGDYAYFTYIQPDGDQVILQGSTLDSAGLSVSVLNAPAVARPNSPLFLEWEVNGFSHYYSSIRWDTTSHACDRKYAFYGSSVSGTSLVYTGSLMAPSAGTIYVSIAASMGGHEVWSPEIAIPVMDMAPVIVDPVNGTTNDPTPTLLGYGPAGEVVNIFDGDAPLGSTSINAEGRFSFTVPTPLGETSSASASLAEPVHQLRVVTSSLVASNTVNLSVDSDLIVDPMHTFFTVRDLRFRIKDAAGYVNLGGRIWVRPNETVAVEMPTNCSNVLGASLQVGSGEFALVNGGGGVWVGTFLLPSDDYAVTASINCDGEITPILLTYGLIDPDGYAFDTLSLVRMPGVTVTCYRLDTTSGQFVPWDAATWDQINPQTTDQDAYYSFIVPPGTYKVKASYPGYREYASPELVVVDAPVHHNLPMEVVTWLKLFLPVTLK